MIKTNCFDFYALCFNLLTRNTSTYMVISSHSLISPDLIILEYSIAVNNTPWW